jgi:hypothetical protein
MRGHIAASEQATVHAGMQRLHASVHHLESREIVDRPHLHAAVGERLLPPVETISTSNLESALQN